MLCRPQDGRYSVLSLRFNETKEFTNNSWNHHKKASLNQGGSQNHYRPSEFKALSWVESFGTALSAAPKNHSPHGNAEFKG